MPYTVTEYAGGQILATFDSADDAVAYAMRKTMERIPTDGSDPNIIYQGVTGDDDAPWLVVEVFR